MTNMTKLTHSEAAFRLRGLAKDAAALAKSLDKICEGNPDACDLINRMKWLSYVSGSDLSRIADRLEEMQPAPLARAAE